MQKWSNSVGYRVSTQLLPNFCSHNVDAHSLAFLFFCQPFCYFCYGFFCLVFFCCCIFGFPFGSLLCLLAISLALCLAISLSLCFSVLVFVTPFTCIHMRVCVCVWVTQKWIGLLLLYFSLPLRQHQGLNLGGSRSTGCRYRKVKCPSRSAKVGR